MKPAATPWAQIYLSVGLTALGTLLLALSLARVNAAVLPSGAAFLATFLPLSGLGVGGLFASSDGQPRFVRLGRLAGINCVLVVAALAVARGGHSLALVCLAAFAPFLLAGMILASAFAETRARADAVFGCLMLGAGGGCLMLPLLLAAFGGPGAMLAAGVVFASAAAIWHSLGWSVRGRIASVALALALVTLLAVNNKRHMLDVHYARGEERLARWTGTGRTALVQDTGGWGIRVDDAAPAPMAALRADSHTGLAYQLRPAARVLVIVAPGDAGGAAAVGWALASGSGEVTVVESNPVIATTIMRERFADLSGGLYLRPEVRVITEDGRSFLRRNPARYGVVQVTLPGGGSALDATPLATSDAVREYLNHLSEDGIAAFTGLAAEPPRESLRLVSLAIEALNQTGQARPAEHVIAARNGQRDVVLVARRPFNAADVDRARGYLADSGALELYLPGHAPAGPFARLLDAKTGYAFQQAYPYEIAPVNDNRPFFLAGLRALAIPSLPLAGLLWLLPSAALAVRLRNQPSGLGVLSYFAFTGIGYGMTMGGLLGQLMLFFGSASEWRAVVQAAMLAATGIGGLASRRLVGDQEGRLIKTLGLGAVLTALVALVAAAGLPGATGLPAAAKVVVAMPAMALAFVLGMPFPAVLRRVDRAATGWAWALHTAAGVLGMVGAVACTIYLGMVQTMMVGGILYLAAMAVVARADIRQPESEEPGHGRVLLADGDGAQVNRVRL